MLLYYLDQDKEFKHLNHKVLVSCPHHLLGSGGLYLLNFEQNSFQQVFHGNCRGIVRDGNKFIMATNSHGLIILDHHFNAIQKTERFSLDFHGAAKLGKNHLLITETGINAIGCYDIKTLSRVGEIRLHPAQTDENHVNDIYIKGNKLYISMFSSTEGWQHNLESETGCIAAVDLSSFSPGDHVEIIPSEHIEIDHLFMPHSVKMYKNEIAYCNSMKFQAVIGKEMSIQFQGYTRGLDFMGDMILVGQSRMRHFNRLNKYSNCTIEDCTIEAGIHVYKQSEKISRFIPLPVSQIYQILVL